MAWSRAVVYWNRMQGNTRCFAQEQENHTCARTPYDKVTVARGL